MWNLREDQVRTAGGGVQLFFTPADHGEVQRRAAEMGADLVEQRVLESAAGSEAVRRLAGLLQEYAAADVARQAAEGKASRLCAERAEAADSCQPGLASRLVELDRQAAEARAGAGQGIDALEPLLDAAYGQALAEIRARQRGETARAGAEADGARAEAVARLAALPEVQECLTTLGAAAVVSFAGGSAPLGGSAEGLLAAALRQAAAEPAPAEERAADALATMG